MTAFLNARLGSNRADDIFPRNMDECIYQVVPTLLYEKAKAEKVHNIKVKAAEDLAKINALQVGQRAATATTAATDCAMPKGRAYHTICTLRRPPRHAGCAPPVSTHVLTPHKT